MEQTLNLDNTFLELDQVQLSEIDGGAISIVIAGVTFVGWKAAVLIGAGVTTVAGAAALGLWNGYWDTRK